MQQLASTLVLVTLVGCGARSAAPPSPSVAPPPVAPRFNADGTLAPPTDYRTWVFLTSGYAMSYGPVAVAAAATGVQLLDNVFVDRRSYLAFLDSGVWPEATMFVLELRTAEGTGSIVTNGRFQTDLAGLEVAVKDTARFPDGGWGYFDFATDAHGPTEPSAVLPSTASCYGCHRANAAVEQTFTQFYPTLLPVARAHGTVRADFVGIPPSATELTEQILAHGWSSAARRLEDVATRWPTATVLREGTLNTVGYQLLQRGKPADAIAVLTEVTRRFPTSTNAWDSLSEVLEPTGDLVATRAAVEHGLALVDADPALASATRAALRRSLEERAARVRRCEDFIFTPSVDRLAPAQTPGCAYPDRISPR